MNQFSEKDGVKVSPAYRWLENAHILLWLLKDTCWALEYKAGGIFMIFPTISVALFILWQSRHIKAELYHNIAVCLWIMANSVWMIGEFADSDTRYYAAGFFIAGLVVLAVYYIGIFPNERKKKKAYVLNTEQESGQVR